MNRIQPVNPVNYAYNIQANRGAKNQQNSTNLNAVQQNRNAQNQQLVTRVRHEDEANNQASGNMDAYIQVYSAPVTLFHPPQAFQTTLSSFLCNPLLT